MSIPVMPFQRATAVGSFKLARWLRYTTTHAPPVRVTNLEASYVATEHEDPKRVHLAWTVPAGHATHTQGKPLMKKPHRSPLTIIGHPISPPTDNSLEMRASWSLPILLDDFKRGYKIEESTITDGQLTYVEGSRNNVTVDLPSDAMPSRNDRRMNVYISLRYVDGFGTTGQVSNVAYVTFGVSRVKLEVPNALESGDMPKIVGIVAGSVLGMLLLALAAIIVVKKCRKSPTDDLDDDSN